MNSNSSIFDEKISKWLLDQSFYHGFLPREDLPYLLKKKGDYIVRSNMKSNGKEKRQDYVLSVAWPLENVPLLSSKDIKSIHMDRNGNGVWLDSTKKFPSPGALFDYYKSCGITTAKGVIRLLRPVRLQFWEFKHSQIMVEKKVGQGAYGEVYKGKVKRGTKTFEAAIKAIKSGVDAADEKTKEVMAEARLMRSLNHPNIVRLRGIAVLEQPVYIIIDFISGGGLDSYLKKHESTLTVDDKNKMAISAAWGIEFMHSHDIIHRDIAARNCLYDKKNMVKLSDFGLSRKGSVYKMNKAMKMPTRWLAPESLTTFTFTRATDVYTFGVLLYEIYMCQEPMQKVNGAEAKKLILAGQFPDFESQAPSELYEIVQSKIYQMDPANRGTMLEIVKLLEQWLQVELVLDDSEVPPDAESGRSSNRAKTEDFSNCSKSRKRNNTVIASASVSRMESDTGNNVREKEEKAAPPTEKAAPPTRSPSRNRPLSRERVRNSREVIKNSKERDSPKRKEDLTSDAPSTQTSRTSLSGDPRDMDMNVPPTREDICVVSPAKEFDSVRTQAKPNKRSSER